MATIPTDVQQRINNMYNQQKNTQLGELRANQQRETNAINTQKTETGQQYYDKRNQADVVNFQNRRSLQEMMAASGLSRSGENISGQVGLQTARQNTLGGLNRDEQGILSSLNQRINEINDPSKANNIISAIESQRSSALAEALERAIERQRQQEQFQAQLETERLAREEQKRQFEARLAWEKEQYNRQMAQQAAKRSSGGSSSRSRSTGSASSSGSANKTLADLYNEYQQTKGKTNLNTLQKRSSVPARQAVKSIGELLAERNKTVPVGGGGGRRWLSAN